MSDLYAVANTCMPVEYVCYRNMYVLCFTLQYHTTSVLQEYLIMLERAIPHRYLAITSIMLQEHVDVLQELQCVLQESMSH